MTVKSNVIKVLVLDKKCGGDTILSKFLAEKLIHQGLVLHPTCVPEKLGVNKKRK
jgi:hypothetical protein